MAVAEIYHTHLPVLLHEAVDNLITDPDGIYIDATFGRGSHSRAILEKLSPRGQLLAFDQDKDAIDYAHSKMQDKRFYIYHTSFTHIAAVVSDLAYNQQISGILFDLGVSSPQLDNPQRGFSFSKNAPLDMRMDTTRGITAGDWINSISEKDLAEVLWQYGEERFSRRIAKAIITQRQLKPISTTVELAELIKANIPGAEKYDRHPATRSFQAIRIAVNDELNALRQGLQAALDCLKITGRLAVISFHSLEDRIVKQFLQMQAKGPELPRGLPIQSSFQPKIALLGKIKPSQRELQINPRARSAILRLAEKR